MKVLQINTSVNMGSVGRRAEDIGNMLIKKGEESYIAISSRLNRPSTSNLVVIGNSFDVKMHGLKSRLFDKHGFGSKGATEKFIDELDKINPDIIHLRNLHGYYLNIEVLFNYLAKKNKPVVWTFHDCWPFTGHCAFFDKVNCFKWKTGCYECPNIKAYPNSWGKDNSNENYERKKELFNSVKKMVLVGVCNWIGNYLKESFLNKYPVEVIYNGIDTNIFRPDTNLTELKAKLKITNEKIILGSANIWDWRKGLSDFVEISPKLPKDVKIVLIGLTKEQQKDLPSNIIGVDRTDNITELASMYSLADVYVNPTYVDNFPTTNIESQSAGTPVVTYKTGGSPEAINENTGLVVEKGDKEWLTKAIQTVLENGKEHYTNYCRERAVDNFDKKDNNEAYYKLYQSLLN